MRRRSSKINQGRPAMPNTLENNNQVQTWKPLVAKFKMPYRLTIPDSFNGPNS